MTNQQILTKAIEKAVAGGWDGFDLNGIHINAMDDFADDTRVSWPTIIFDRDFANALWPIDDNVYHLDREYVNPSIGGHYDEQEQVPMQLWQLNLMQMVIANNPIKYLGEHI